MLIRRAEERDIEGLNALLRQVLAVHNRIRPDLFRPVGKKYTDEELKALLQDDDTPIFVAEEGGSVKGYAFCVMESVQGSSILNDARSLYIDDLCVDEACRRQQIGLKLFEYVKRYAKQRGCGSVTLNVWNGNDAARIFYEKQGMTERKTTMELKL